eukprot:GFYU01052093.1.p2 GENE.GFYU01052093.1~~GFYU01052093.1.p2  ORF type:complete len:131 (-),score=30.01 GFYU01052093.1:171-563(-)
MVDADADRPTRISFGVFGDGSLDIAEIRVTGTEYFTVESAMLDAPETMKNQLVPTSEGFMKFAASPGTGASVYALPLSDIGFPNATSIPFTVHMLVKGSKDAVPLSVCDNSSGIGECDVPVEWDINWSTW